MSRAPKIEGLLHGWELDKLDQCIDRLAIAINGKEQVEEALFSVLSQILQRYVRCGYQDNYADAFPSQDQSPEPAECDPLVGEVVGILSLFDGDKIEEVLRRLLTQIFGLTLCHVFNAHLVSRSMGVMRRVDKFLDRQDYWGDEGIRYGRSLGILRYVELALYRRISPASL